MLIRKVQKILFLLTHPVWDVTYAHGSLNGTTANFYSHIPCGMWPFLKFNLSQYSYFYSHIPCGMWQNCEGYADVTADFYSHIPCGMWQWNESVWHRRQWFLLTHPVWDVTSLSMLRASSFSFLLTHPVWDVTWVIPRAFLAIAFLLTHPVWDVTDRWFRAVAGYYISTHTSRVGCDYITEEQAQKINDFYSHIPCGMWHDCPAAISIIGTFLLTHPVWDVTDLECHQCTVHKISTHTSRVGCDDAHACGNRYPKAHFYSHIPCGMWRRLCRVRNWRVLHFYSHIPCGMWQTAPNRAYRQRIISTHTSRVGCDIAFNLVDEHTVISTHTSRVGCDNLWDTLERRGLISTHTSRVGCDAVEDWCLRRGAISTHTSRVGCDGEEWQFRSVSVDFYSHIPCGMWPIPEVSSTVSKAFLLTHPVWDVTSILLCLRSSGTFLLTHPVWDVTANTANNCIVQGISTHTSRVGCDDMPRGFPVLHVIFLLTHPVWDVTAIYSILQPQHPHISRDGLIIHLELY